MVDTLEFGELTITDLVKPGRQIYDGKALWVKYHSMGPAATYDKLKAWASSNGMKKTKKPSASRMGVYFAMWRYAVRYPDEAWPIYREWAMAFENELTAEGVEINFDMFIKDVKKHAETPGCIGREPYVAFCEKYGLIPKSE